MGVRASGPFPASPLHPAPTGTWLRASGYQLLVRLAGRGGGHGCAFPGSRHLHHMRQTWESGAERCGLGAAEDPGRKEGERREGQRAGRWQRAVSDFWRRPVRDRKRALQEGRWGRSREVPGGHVLPSGRPPPPPCDSSPSPSPNPKVLQVRRATPCSLLQPAVQGTPLTIPKAPPTHTHSLGTGTPLAGSTQGRGKRAAKSEVSR